MAITCALSLGAGATSACAERPMNFVVTVANGNASAVTLLSLSINPASGDARIAQPLYLTPNVPVGVGNPVIAASSSASYGFQVVFDSPAAAGPSPNNPGGAAPSNTAETPDPFFVLQAIGNTSDGSVFSSTLLVPVLSAIPPFPIPEGGALYFTQGSNLLFPLTLGLI